MTTTVRGKPAAKTNVFGETAEQATELMKKLCGGLFMGRSLRAGMTLCGESFAVTIHNVPDEYFTIMGFHSAVS